MAATAQISPTSAAWLAVTVISPSGCKSVRITENRGVAGWPTSDFLIAKPTTSATPVRVQAGAQYTFGDAATFWKLGDIAGYIKMVTGSTTFDQDEDVGWSQGRTF
jgi:hypothetical protein